MSPIYTIDALNDERWRAFVDRHPRSSVFHTHAWLRALQLTYGYRPFVLTTTPPDRPLTDGTVFCEVKSWITGQRLVSLPFSDHCDLLTESTEKEAEILAYMEGRVGQNLRYAEIRPLQRVESAPGEGWRESCRFCFHMLALDVPSDQLFRNFHKDCIQRKVRRAEREDLVYETGRSEHLLRQFYELMLRTRRRHGLPPQPIAWFRNLMGCLGENMAIQVATKDSRAIAAILTLIHKDTIVYKYGCSDERFNQLGASPFLFWKVIQEAKDSGMRQFDLGRSDLDNQGLVAFKSRLGATKSEVTYWRYSKDKSSDGKSSEHLAKLGKHIFSLLPDSVLVQSGRLLYRHMG